MEKEYLIHSRPLRALLTFAVPMMVGNLFQQFYTMTDSVVVGRFVSEDALAAVGACTSLTNVFIAVAIGGGVGASVVVSRYFGSRDYGTMKRAVYTALLAFLAVSIALGGLGLLAGRRLMLWLQTPQDVFEMAMDYLNIYFLGLPFLFMYNVLSAMFNALGRSRIPLYLLIFSSVTNIVLDVYAVVELGMGVPGVAWATLIAQGISAVLSFVIFLREMRALPGTSDRCFDGPELGRMTRIALPSILQQSTVSIGMLLVQSVVNGFGSEVLAGYTAGHGQRHVVVHGSESGRRPAGPGRPRLSGGVRHRSRLCRRAGGGAGAVLHAADFPLFGRRRDAGGRGNRGKLPSVHRLVLRAHRPENDDGRPAPRRR